MAGSIRSLSDMLEWCPIPRPSPGPLRDKLVLAWIAFKASEAERFRGKAESQLSILFLELLMRYSSESAAEAARVRLAKPKTPKAGGWLTLTTPSRGRLGNFYKPGKLAEPSLDEWVQVGEMLFGPGGAMEPYRCRPLFSSAGIGPVGCIVLAAIERCGPVTADELVELLKSYTTPKTIRRHLGYVKGYELIRQRGDRYFTPPDIREQVVRLERDLGAADRCLEIDNARDRKWIAFQTEILGKPEIDLIKATLRKLDCFYCGRPPRPTGGQVERFPPRKWGGSYEHSLLLPICWKCNTRHGNQLGRSTREFVPLIDEPIQIYMAGDSADVVDHFAKLMASNSMEYAVAMDEGRIGDAKEAALRSFTTWAAIKGLGAGVRIVDVRSGEIRSEPSSRDELTFLEFLEDFKGVPALLVPRPPEASRKRAKRQAR